MSDSTETTNTAPLAAATNTAPIEGVNTENAEQGKTATETPKPPPSTKDWAAVTAAEKRARAIEAKAKEEAKKLQAERQAFEVERSQKSAGLEALKEAYKSGDYSQIEKEFPDLYKKLTQSKLKAGGVQKPISEEALLAKFEEKQKALAAKQAEQYAQQAFQEHESNFVYTMESNKDKYPLLMIESTESPDLIRSKLREIAEGKEQMTYQAAADKIEAWLRNRFEQRQKALGTLSPTQTKTETVPDSPNKDTTQQGQNKSSDGPTTLSQRMTQESSLSSYENQAIDEKSPTMMIRKRQEAEKAILNKAIADFKESMKKQQAQQE